MAKTQKASLTKKADLRLSVPRIRKSIKTQRIASRVSLPAPVYMAAAIEYLAHEILDMSGQSAKDNRKKLIRPRDIMFAIRNDEDMDTFIGSACITDAGILPKIAPELLKRETHRREQVKARAAKKAAAAAEAAQ